jgi:hypothetical protein
MTMTISFAPSAPPPIPKDHPDCLDRRALAGGVLRIFGGDAVLQVALERLLQCGGLDARVRRNLFRRRDRIAEALDPLIRLLMRLSAPRAPDLRRAESIASIGWSASLDGWDDRTFASLIDHHAHTIADCDTVLALARSVADREAVALLGKHRRLHAAQAASLRRSLRRKSGF